MTKQALTKEEIAGSKRVSVQTPLMEQQSKRELYHYVNRDIIERSLNRLSEKLGGDEKVF